MSLGGVNDISLFKNADFYIFFLLILNLYKNNIKDVSVFKKVKINQLQIFGLSENNNKDIDILEKVKFNKLQIIGLGHNNISDISIFKKVNWIKTIKFRP